MLLKVGELARRTGITVRTLHHYDSIGLLQPSARTEAGYRLYDAADIARLHGIQALQALGLPLEEIGQVLGEGGAALPGIIDRQLQGLQRQIDDAMRLRQHLQLVQRKFAAGGLPTLEDWLATLSLMTTSSRHFSAEEMARIFADWESVRGELDELIADIQALMATGARADDLRTQPLAQRWMSMMHTWMAGDYELMERWGRMYLSEPSVQGPAHVRRAIVDFIEPAVQQRLALLRRHIGDEALRSLRNVPTTEWRTLAADVQALMDAGQPPHGAAAAACARRWLAMLDRMVRGDRDLLARLQRAYMEEPLLRAGTLVAPPQRDFLVQAAALLHVGVGAGQGAGA